MEWILAALATLALAIGAILGVKRWIPGRAPKIKPLSPEALERLDRRRKAEEAAEDAALAAILKDAERFDPNDGRFDERTKRLAARAVRRQNRLD